MMLNWKACFVSTFRKDRTLYYYDCDEWLLSPRRIFDGWLLQDWFQHVNPECPVVIPLDRMLWFHRRPGACAQYDDEVAALGTPSTYIKGGVEVPSVGKEPESEEETMEDACCSVDASQYSRACRRSVR